MLVILFGLLIPAVAIQTFTGTDAKSKNPVVQAGNLEAAVRDETAKDRQSKLIQGVITATAPTHTTDEDAAAVYAGAMMELHRPLSTADLAPLAKSKIAARRSLVGGVVRAAASRSRADEAPCRPIAPRAIPLPTRPGTGSGTCWKYLVRQIISPQLDEKAGKFNAICARRSLRSQPACRHRTCLDVRWWAWFGRHNGKAIPLNPRTSTMPIAVAIRAAQMFGVFILVDLFTESVIEMIPEGSNRNRLPDLAGVFFGNHDRRYPSRNQVSHQRSVVSPRRLRH